MTKKEIVKQISERIGLTQLKTKEIVQLTFDAIVDTLIEDTRIELRSSGAPEPTKGGADVYQVSPATYVWHPGGEHGFPRPDLPPAHTTLDSLATAIRLPPFSLTVARTTPLP